MSKDIYNSYLSKEIVIMSVLMAICFILAIILVFLLKNAIGERKKDSIVADSILLAILCLGIIGTGIYIAPFALDLKEEAYIKHEGKYYVQSTSMAGRGGGQWTYISFSEDQNAEKFELYPNPDYLVEGEHEGYIVYSKRSKVILEWDCTYNHVQDVSNSES